MKHYSNKITAQTSAREAAKIIKDLVKKNPNMRDGKIKLTIGTDIYTFKSEKRKNEYLKSIKLKIGEEAYSELKIN